MSKRVITYPLWFAFSSLLAFGLVILCFVFDNDLFILYFGVLSLLLAITSLIGSGINLIRRNKIGQSVLSIILSLIPFCFICWVQTSMWLHQRRHSESHGSAYTINDMQRLAWEIQFFAEDTKREIPRQLDEICRLLRRSSCNIYLR